MYATVQQNYRQSANDPQIQMAEDAAIKLTRGTFIFPQQYVDIAQSLSPFMMVFDTSGQVTSSQAFLDGTTPVLPQGVFADTKAKTETRFTWQPKDDVRIAAVVVATPTGFVLAGRNVREVEIREKKLEIQIAGGWIASLVFSFFAVAISRLVTVGKVSRKK